MRRIGFVVNPIAGMGGRVGLKGTDGKVAEARSRGAEPRAPDRGIAALETLTARGEGITLFTWGGKMGETAAEAADIQYTVRGKPDRKETSAADTKEAVRAFVEQGVDLVLFVGGDGTAVDILEALESLPGDGDVPILGVPAGVKVYSSVFAVSPRAAGRIAATFESTETREVNDIDEDAYREGRVEAELRGLATVPVAEDLQSGKQVLGGDVSALAAGVVEEMAPDVTYVLGPGGTLQTIKDELGIEGSPLGVDVVKDGTVLARDAAESDILDALGTKNVIVVSPIGGQGFIFGRGNDQLSPAVIRQCDLEVVASREKLDSTGVLRVDTGDEDLDADLEGWIKVRIGRYERRMMKIV
ncbi:MAG: ATP-NAD kinase family protein [Halodesulfurarchaeum sp.]